MKSSIHTRTHAIFPARGFTLIELSIVLVIIGLIVGGVLTGKTLIDGAKKKQMHRKFEEIATAYNTFRTKYNCLPGDCARASTFGLGSNGNGNNKHEGGGDVHPLI